MSDETSTMCVAIVLTPVGHHRRIAQRNWNLSNEQMVGMHVHHRIPVSQGGTNDPSNLFVCSAWFHARIWHGPGAVLEMGWPFRENFKHSEETRRKMSQLSRGRAHSRETKQKMSESQKKFWDGKTEEERKAWGQRWSEKLKGKSTGPCTEERKKKLSQHFKNYTFPEVECPHCGKTGTIAPMKRWHFNNCKQKNA